MSKTLLLAIFIAAIVPPIVRAQIETASPRCQMVQRIIVDNHLSTRDLSGSMFCEVTKETKEYVVFGVRYKRNIKKEGEGSNLVGWYALRLKDDTLFEWDITRESFGGPGFRAGAQ